MSLFDPSGTVVFLLPVTIKITKVLFVLFVTHTMMDSRKLERFSFCFPFPDVPGTNKTQFVPTKQTQILNYKRGYDLVVHVPRYRMVRFGSHLTQSERAGVNKLFLDHCRDYRENVDAQATLRDSMG